MTVAKALQLMEFLVKNGSERVIDDARSHLSLLKMLRQFHYIDQNGKDQGLNVRNRSKELTDLLSDVEKIRQERKKARATRNKYGGVEGGAGLGGGMSTGSKYGGFGSEDQGGYGGFSGGVYGDGGGFGGASAGTEEYEPGTSVRRQKFDEYDEYDEGSAGASTRRKADTRRTASTAQRNKKQPEPPKPKEPEVDLFDFGDDDLPAAAPIPTSNGKQPATSSAGGFGALQAGGADDDDFDDFQSATPSTQPVSQPTLALGSIPPPTSTSTPSSSTQYAAPQPRVGAQGADFSNLFATTSPAPSTSATPSAMSAFSPPPLQQQQQAVRSTGYQQAAPNYFTSVSVQPAQAPATAGVKSPGVTSPMGSIGGSKPKSSGGDAFASLLGGTGLKGKTPTSQGLTMADMAKQKSSAGIWGTPAAAPAPTASQPRAQPRTGGGGAMDDLLG